MSEPKPPMSPEQPTEKPAEQVLPERRFISPEEVISIDDLNYLIEGRRVVFVPLTFDEMIQARLEGRSGWYTKDVGKSDPRREIHYHPETLGESVGRIRALCIHEACHHAPPVEELDRRVRKATRSVEVPTAFRETPRLMELFKQMLERYFVNVIADRFLEAYASRHIGGVRYYLPDFQAKLGGLTAGRDLTKTSGPLAMQYMQKLLGAERFFGGENQDRAAPPVEEAFKESKAALESLDDVAVFERYLKYADEVDQALRAKAYAVEHLILPRFVKLLEADIEQVKKDEQAKKESGQPDQPGQGGQSGQGEKLTPEQAEALAKMLQAMIEAGLAELVPMTEQEAAKEGLGRAVKLPNTPLVKSRGSGQPSIGSSSEPGEPGEERPEESPWERARRQAQEALEGFERWQRSKQAREWGVSEQAIRDYDQYKEQFSKEIVSLRDSIIEVMREERASRFGFTLPFGEVTPGLEREKQTAEEQGEPDARLHMNLQTGRHFSKVRLLFVVDVSGSMYGAPLKASRQALVIINEAFLQARQMMKDENLLATETEEPFEFGVLAFEGGVHMVHEFGTPLTDAAKYKIMGSLTAGGGTNDLDGLEGGIKKLEERARDDYEEAIHIMAVFTDGDGDKNQVQAFANRVRRTEEASIGVFGFGEHAQHQVREVYGGRPDGIDAVYGNHYPDPANALPEMSRYIAGRVTRRIEKKLGIG